MEGTTHSTGYESEQASRARKAGRTPLYAGVAVAALAIVAIVVAAWPGGPFSASGGGVVPTATTRPVATPTTRLAPTPTTMALPTFTQVPVTYNGPHVRGITAGVGMRSGEIEGVVPVAVSFSEAMNQASAQAAFSIQPAAAGSFQWKGDTLLFTPASPLKPATSYTVTLASSARTKGGAALVAGSAQRFQTTAPPNVLRTLPSPGASEVPTDTIVTITFNRPMIPLTALDNQPDASKWITIRPAVAGRWVWLGTAAAGFRADTGFLPATGYTVEVKAGWPDAAGVALTQGTTVNFTTIKPAIRDTAPSNGAQDVPLDSPVVVSFNMAMDHASAQGAFSVKRVDQKNPLAGSFQWSPDSTVMTFTAKSLLEFSQSYVATFSGPVKAATGGAAEMVGGSGTNSWSFRSTDPTHVEGYTPDSRNGLAQPSGSFGFYFNNPLAPGQNVSQFLTVDPVPQDYIGLLEVNGSGVYTDQVKLLPNTTYNFSLKAGLKDKWGFPVSASNWQVKIGPLPPALTLQGGTFQPVNADGPTRVRLEATNLGKVTLSLYTLTENDMRSALRNGVPYDYNTNGQQPKPFGRLARQWDVTVPPGDQGKSTFYPTVGLDANADRLPAGYYTLVASAPSPYGDGQVEVASVLIVGRAGVVIKTEGTDMLVWVASLTNGAPLANYPLRIEQWSPDPNTKPQVLRGQTGSDGVLRIKLDASVQTWMDVVWSEQQGDAMAATTGWSRNLEPWSYGMPGAYTSTPDTQRAAIYTERPIYRPAQVVYFRGVVRTDDDASYSLPKTGQNVYLVANSYNSDTGEQTTVYTGTAVLSKVGTFSGEFTLPGTASTGNYTLAILRSSGANYYDSITSTSFSVEEYRKPDFQVNVTAPTAVVKGDGVPATIQASYYFGGPLSNVTTTVNIKTDPYYFYWADPDTGESYTFGDYERPWIYDYSYPGKTDAQKIDSFQVRTGPDGIAKVDVTRYITTTEGSRSALVEGQIQDLSNQAVANSTNVIVHQGLYYIGLRTEDYIATAKQPLTVTVRTVEWTGKRTTPGVPITLRFVRQEWALATDGSGEWKMNEVPVGQASVTTGADGRATYLFSPPSGGMFKVIAEGRDARGNAIRSGLEFWAASQDPGYVPWRFANDQQLSLVADKKLYQVGDTARILVTSPFEGQATGLLTIERGHLKRYRIVTLQGGAPTIDVPLQAGDLPNVYVSLSLLGQQRTPDGAPAGWPGQVAMRAGYVDLPLDTSGKKLQVSIEPEGKSPYEPGSTITVTVRTRDANGGAAPGEVSLAVVDEAIYAIAGDSDPNLFGTFWGERGVGVNTSTSFSAGDTMAMGRGGAGLAEGAMPSAAPQATAGMASQDSKSAGTRNAAGEPAQPQKVRVDFRDTAFWKASVETGDDGTAQVQVPLPDNLTTWRLTAQGLTADTRFGTTSTPVTVTQPLLLRPVLPRFLTTGDNPHPQAIVHNNTGQALEVEASLVVSGAIALDAQPAAAQRITIQAGDQAVVTWSGKVGQGNVANFRYWVHTVGKQGADYRGDAVAAHLPVLPFAAPEAVATSGEVAGTRTDESVFLPYSVSPLLGELVVQVSPSLAAATTDSLKFVQEYPYDSTDQAVSRFLPLVVLEKVYNEQGLTTPYSKDIPDIVAKGLKRLAELQQPDGGWAWWEEGPSSWWETAYVVQGLVAARDAGYTVPANMLQRGIEALRNFMSSGRVQGLDETYHLNMRAYSLYVLGMALGSGAGDFQADGRDLLNQAARLSAHAKAWLAMGLAEIGLNADAKKALDSLAAAARQTSTTAHWEEGQPDYWSMGTDNRATALAIDALVTLSPNDPLVPKAVRWLMSAEREGHWLSSQETAISLVALAHYIRQSKELQGNYNWQVTAFDKLMGQGVANSSTLTQTTTLTLPVAGLPQNDLGALTLSRSGTQGKMYYSASLRYYVPGDGIKARSEGMGIARSYYKVVNGVASTSPVKEVQAGDLVKVRLTIVAPETAYYVLVTDPLPAGLEGVNGSLNTTSFTERPPDPRGTDVSEKGGYSWWWRWGPFDNVEMRDDRTVLFASYMGAGTYVYEYFARATTPGVYMSLPARAELLYYPDVFGRSDGGTFTVK